MIARLTGTPVARTADGLVLDVAGVGYLLRATDRAHRKAKEGREVTLDTYLHVREDALQLYGFAEPPSGSSSSSSCPSPASGRKSRC